MHSICTYRVSLLNMSLLKAFFSVLGPSVIYNLLYTLLIQKTVYYKLERIKH